jgi:hypothetical protein
VDDHTAPSILDTLASLNTAEDSDTALILAGAINLYSESIRRRQGRILYYPSDVRRLLAIADLLLEAAQPEAIAQARSAEPDDAEVATIVNPDELRRRRQT